MIQRRECLRLALEPLVLDLEGGEPRAVGPPGAVGVAVSPDGRAFYGFVPNGRSGLYPVDGGEPTPCCQLQPGEGPIRWGQDARSLICRRDSGSTSAIFLLDITTGRRKPPWELSPLDRAGASGLAGIFVTPDARAYAYSFFRDSSGLYLVDGLK
jgi:hypothetical protein